MYIHPILTSIKELDNPTPIYSPFNLLFLSFSFIEVSSPSPTYVQHVFPSHPYSPLHDYMAHHASHIYVSRPLTMQVSDNDLYLGINDVQFDN